MLFTLLAILLFGYALICAVIFTLQRSLIYFPQPRSFAAAGSTMRLPVQGADLEITVHNENGPNAIVYFGGNAEDVSQNLRFFVTSFPGQAIYLMHYRGYGGSSGNPTEKANVADAIQLVKRVLSLHPNVALIGRSLGSGVAIQVASRTAASRLILITPFDSLVEIATRIYPYLPVRWLALDRYESGKFAPAITTPTTLIEAEHDEEIPHASTQRLLGRFSSGVATHVLIEGVGHNDLDDSEKYLDTLRAALR